MMRLVFFILVQLLGLSLGLGSGKATYKSQEVGEVTLDESGKATYKSEEVGQMKQDGAAEAVTIDGEAAVRKGSIVRRQSPASETSMGHGTVRKTSHPRERSSVTSPGQGQALSMGSAGLPNSSSLMRAAAMKHSFNTKQEGPDCSKASCPKCENGKEPQPFGDDCACTCPEEGQDCSKVSCPKCENGKEPRPFGDDCACTCPEEGPDCSKVSCPKCENGKEPQPFGDDCGCTCPEDDECSQIQCPQVTCQHGVKPQPSGKCGCFVCPKEDDCSETQCPQFDGCPNGGPVPSGKCGCPACPEDMDDGTLDGMDGVKPEGEDRRTGDGDEAEAVPSKPDHEQAVKLSEECEKRYPRTLETCIECGKICKREAGAFLQCLHECMTKEHHSMPGHHLLELPAVS